MKTAQCGRDGSKSHPGNSLDTSTQKSYKGLRSRAVYIVSCSRRSRVVMSGLFSVEQLWSEQNTAGT